MDLLDELLQRPEWMYQGACIGENPNLFFPNSKRDGFRDRNRAVNICHTCPVQAECGAWALDENHIQRFGIWGGMTERQRNKIIQRRRRDAGLDTYGRPKIEVTV
jgi:WhiB family redox-sensing transcriptional regulator